MGRFRILSVIVLMVILAGCASGKKQAVPPVQMGSGGTLVTMEASSYKFSPGEIKLEKPGLLALEIKNVSGSEHNFTLKDPRGKVIKNVNIRPHSSIISNLDLSDSGTYEFFCDKTLHSTMGMKGKIVVGTGK